MLMASLVRSADRGWRNILFAITVIAVLAGVLYVLGPWIKLIGNWNLVIFFAVLLGLGVLAGVPIAFCFGLSTVSYLLLTTTTPIEVIPGRCSTPSP